MDPLTEKIIIRPAELNDLKDIQALNLLLFKKEYAEFDKTLNCELPFSPEGEKYFKEHIENKDCCSLVAQAGKGIVGYLVGDIHRDETPYRILPLFAELQNMLVLAEYRGQGIGDQLVQEFIKWCRTKNVGRLRVVASAQNTPAIDFYRQQGFKDYSLILESDL